MIEATIRKIVREEIRTALGLPIEEPTRTFLGRTLNEIDLMPRHDLDHFIGVAEGLEAAAYIAGVDWIHRAREARAKFDGEA